MGIFDKFKKDETIETDNTYMTILDCFTIKNIGVVTVCMIEEGEIGLYDSVQINGKTDKIAALECNGKNLKCAESGMIVGVLLKNIQISDAVKGEKILKL